ncbi:TonB-dependent receptor [Sphingomonas sp. SUN019]|uniref:TonB-dependent receptor domain-containing protein n=1 Tax=Sphingomonas sp. SUN019 TaxID=2937788 RepID=UPI0021640D01|nr:TonB-dependent receptor [Sphingomonas sp. SUN019]UVO50445.1 TonB-dependent receptor [Sphingomonas sp. SUN019]
MMNLFRKRLLASTTIAGAVFAASTAYAQTTQEAPISPATTNPSSATPPTDSSDGTQTDDRSGGDIIVTGSRIPRPELESASPVTTIGAAEVKLAGTTRIEDLVNALPQVFAGQGGSISNGATGTATLNLRGLGESRTLVLVNGRRLVPGDPRSPFADINIIPSALLKRVDVLTGGASSVYGADAVAGVVNFIMDTDFEGFKLDGQYSFYQHQNRAGRDVTDALDARGFGRPDGSVADGGTVDVTASFGVGFDDGRGHITAYGGYRKINAITQDRRDYSACSLASTTATSVAAGGRKYNCGGSGTSAPGSFYIQGAYYNVQGNQFVPGQVLFNFAPTNYYQRPDERYTAGFFANYDVSDEFKPYMEFMFMDDRTVAQIAPSGLFFNTSTINCDNPLLSAQQLGIVCNPTNTFVDSTGVTRANLYIGRRNVEGGGRQDDLQHTTYRGVFGARGDVAKGISYDAYYQYSRVNFAQTYRNDFSITRSARAIDVVNVNGTPTCRSVVDGTDPLCVPYNIFTTGGVSAAALNYLQLPLFSRGQTTEQIANASFTFLGSEYGIVSPLATEGFALNVGAEYRNSQLNFEVDSNFLSGDGAGQGGATTPVRGGFNVKEAFVEASLPLIQDRPFFHNLTVGGGYRRSAYETAGNGVSNQFDTDTWKAEATFSPVRDITARVSYSRSARAPNAVELFSAQSIALDGVTDPCAGPAVGGLVNGFTQAQCALTGLTAAQFGNIAANPASQYNGLLGGNPNLTPEIANSFTAGVVLTPSFLRGFQATVDYFNIRIDNQIGILGADTILSQCLATGDPTLCGLINRGASGRLDRADGFVTDTNLNAGRLSTKGIDVTVGYTQEIGSIGTFGVSMVGTWLDQLVTDQVGPSRFDCVGYFGAQCGTPNPEWRHKVRVTYTSPAGPSISGAWRYFSAVDNDDSSPNTNLSSPTGPVAGAVGNRPGNARLAKQNYFDLALTVPVADTFTFRVGANNVLDKQPPLNGQSLGNGNTYSQVYDTLGRYIYTGVTLDF